MVQPDEQATRAINQQRAVTMKSDTVEKGLTQLIGAFQSWQVRALSRMILNLKELNKFVAYQHFKMDSLKCVTSLMTQGCYMASVDTKDAYYTVPVALEHQKYLKFTWKDKLYRYTCLPNGLASVPRIFTKHLKTVFKILRQKRPFIFVIHENKWLLSSMWLIWRMKLVQFKI